MPSADKASLEETAYHEAGHAIIALASGVDVPRLSIIPDGDDLGDCDVEYSVKFLNAAIVNPIGNQVDQELALLRLVAFLAVGRQAQRRLLISQNLPVDEGKLDYWSGKDYQMIYRYLGFLRDLGCEVSIEYLLPQIDAYLLREDVWTVLEALAVSLLEGRELHDLQPADFPLPAFTPLVG